MVDRSGFASRCRPVRVSVSLEIKRFQSVLENFSDGRFYHFDDCINLGNLENRGINPQKI